MKALATWSIYINGLDASFEDVKKLTKALVQTCLPPLPSTANIRTQDERANLLSRTRTNLDAVLDQQLLGNNSSGTLAYRLESIFQDEKDRYIRNLYSKLVSSNFWFRCEYFEEIKAYHHSFCPLPHVTMEELALTRVSDLQTRLLTPDPAGLTLLGLR
jgi:hypothetical protein